MRNQCLFSLTRGQKEGDRIPTGKLWGGPGFPLSFIITWRLQMYLRPFTMWGTYSGNWNWRAYPAMWIIQFTKAGGLPCGPWSQWKSFRQQGFKGIAAKSVKKIPDRTVSLQPVCAGRRVWSGRITVECLRTLSQIQVRKLSWIMIMMNSAGCLRVVS